VAPAAAEAAARGEEAARPAAGPRARRGRGDPVRVPGLHGKFFICLGFFFGFDFSSSFGCGWFLPLIRPGVGAEELPVAARADPAAGRDARRERAAAGGAGDAAHADAGARAGQGARQPRRGHGAAQSAAPRRHAQGRRPVARGVAGRRRVGRQLAAAGGGGRPDQAQGGGRHQARESPRVRILASGNKIHTTVWDGAG
jgi:hypothetical protein